MTDLYQDRPLRFSIPSRHVRGRAVRLDTVLDDILSAHDYPAAIRHILAEAIVLAALIGSLIEAKGSQLTMQVQTERGIVELLVVDYRGGELRGYARFDPGRLAQLGSNPSLFALFGKGYLAITFDQPVKGRETDGRYQGIVPLEGDSLAEACQRYFFQSEQIPTLIKLAVASDTNGCRGGGLLLQHMAEGEQGRERLHVRLDHPEWEHVAALGDTLTHGELLDAGLSMEDIVWRLFHEEDMVRVDPGPALSKGCRCTVAHFSEVIARFPPADRADMVGDDGAIAVGCAFCSRTFQLPPPG